MQSIETAIVKPAIAPLPPEEQARADFYALIANLLLRAPDASLLSALAQADSLHSEQTDNPLDRAWEKLIVAANMVGAGAVNDEFDALFTSIGTPPVNPYGSVYLSGFMMERPLARLREELAMLELSRAGTVAESEDHLGALCEAMRLMITGAGNMPARPVREQRRFFISHIAPWHARCLDDIRDAQGANFYRVVADVAQAFFDIESQAFAIGDGAQDQEVMLS